MECSSDIVLSVRGLKTYFFIGKKQEPVKAVDDVSLEVKKASVTALVGESGSGKSVTSSSIFQLIDPPGKILEGEILLHGKDLCKLSKKQRKSVYGKEISMIFQDPTSALNPVLKVKNQLLEAILLHRNMSKKDALEECRQALRKVSLKDTETVLESYPFELSGGMCQRVMIAMALLSQADVLIADEPTTALDLTIQASVLEEFKKIKEAGIAILFITHDLGIVAQMADYVYVMQQGRIVEHGDVFQIFDHPTHHYTKSLMEAIL